MSEGGAGEIRAVDAGADDLVGRRTPARRLERQLVRQRDGLEDRDEWVISVLARLADEQAEVDLAGRERPEPHADRSPHGKDSP